MPAEAVVMLLKACARLKPGSRRRLIKAIDTMTEALRKEIRGASTLGQVLELAATEDVFQALGLILLDPGQAYAAVCTNSEMGSKGAGRRPGSGSAIRGEAE